METVKISENELLRVCGDIGTILFQSGAETPRIEETVERVGKAAGYQIECYTTLTAIFVSINNGKNDTFLAKPKWGDFNLQKVDEINKASRDFEKGLITFLQLKSRILKIKTKVVMFPFYLKVLGAGLASMAPMLLFDASWNDIFLSFFVGMIGYIVAVKSSTYFSISYISYFLSGLIIGIFSLLLVKLNWGSNAYNITLGAIMPLVPGIAITNSIREIISNEIISGVVRIVQATFVAGSIGFGIILANEVFLLW